jgi:hypothetical protein
MSLKKEQKKPAKKAPKLSSKGVKGATKISPAVNAYLMVDGIKH